MENSIANKKQDIPPIKERRIATENSTGEVVGMTPGVIRSNPNHPAERSVSTFASVFIKTVFEDFIITRITREK